MDDQGEGFRGSTGVRIDGRDISGGIRGISDHKHYSCYKVEKVSTANVEDIDRTDNEIFQKYLGEQLIIHESES